MGYAGYAPGHRVAEAATPVQAALAQVKSDASLELIGKLTRNRCALPHSPCNNLAKFLRPASPRRPDAMEHLLIFLFAIVAAERVHGAWMCDRVVCAILNSPLLSVHHMFVPFLHFLCRMSSTWRKLALQLAFKADLNVVESSTGTHSQFGDVIFPAEGP